MRQVIQNVLDNKGKLEEALNALKPYHIQRISPILQYGEHIGYDFHVHYGNGLTITIMIDKQGFLKNYV